MRRAIRPAQDGRKATIMSKTKVVVSGGFHNSRPITLRVADKLSAGQYKRLGSHMCGIKGCICGWRGFYLEGIPRDTFSEMLTDAAYEASLRRGW
jgi:hypothetical protein